jgi:hypothetical protein
MIMRLFTTKRKLFSSFTPAQMGVKNVYQACEFAPIWVGVNKLIF